MENTRSDANSELISQAEELEVLYTRSSRERFPYEDLRQLVRKAGAHYESLIPDLDLYFSTIVGYCSWGKQILNWDNERRQEALKYVSRGFFDRHSEFKALLPFINKSDLGKQLNTVEEIRTTLLLILTSLEEEKKSAT